MIVEVMGRDAGWIALHAGIAGGAHIILIPEIPFSVESVCSYIGQRHIFGKKFTIISLAEGVQVPEQIRKDCIQRYGSIPKGISVGNLIGEAIALCSNKEVRVTVLGHTQRGGSPSPSDRILSTRFGVAAVDLIAQRGFMKMVALRGGKIVFVDIAEAIGKMKRVRSQGRAGQHRPLRRNSLRRRIISAATSDVPTSAIFWRMSGRAEPSFGERRAE